MLTVKIKCPSKSCGKSFDHKTNNPELIRDYDWWKTHAKTCPSCGEGILFRLENCLIAKVIVPGMIDLTPSYGEEKHNL